MTIRVGDKAPTFVLKDNRNKEIGLSDLRGKRVLLSWHPLAWTGVCADQMKALETNRELLASLNTVALGISVDSVPSKNAWAKELKIAKTKLLSDFWPHGKVAGLYGIFREEEGFSERAAIVVDGTGTVMWVKIYDIPELPDIDEVIGFLRG
ncbi:MAG: peroxiredoxin [Deltaproteobacteria bacterium]|nr:peroxiredoxin [Deltaproteobacteria bacterium]MBW2674636.1 peroxiredoxin [Deltaproteobacteria bacterium]